jgi:hypothetical protein
VYVPEDLPQPCVVHEHHCSTGTGIRRSGIGLSGSRPTCEQRGIGLEWRP